MRPDSPDSHRGALPEQQLPVSQPTVAEGRKLLAAIYRADGDRVWSDLLARAGLRGDETDRESMARLLTTMRGSDRVLELCALSLTIRLNCYDHLAAHQVADYLWDLSDRRAV